MNQIRSGCHRTLHELIRFGYVRQLPQRGDYALTTKLASMGLSFLSKSGVVDIAQPVINRLAQITEELVRLAIVDGERLTLVAKAQGARSGLLYDPDMGIDLRLSCSAAGQAWLMTLPEDVAIEYVTRQGMGEPAELWSGGAYLDQGASEVLEEHRKRRFSIIQDAYAPGMSAMAAPVQRAGEPATGVIVIAGPSPRLTLKRMQRVRPCVACRRRRARRHGQCVSAAKVGQRGHLGQHGGQAAQIRAHAQGFVIQALRILTARSTLRSELLLRQAMSLSLLDPSLVPERGS